jgi:hypothetical protein
MKMFGKLNPYDLFSAFVPGVLLLAVSVALFPKLGEAVKFDAAPDAFVVIVLTVLAYFVGQMTQAISSLCEPFVHWTWGGRPSERARHTANSHPVSSTGCSSGACIGDVDREASWLV